MCPYFLMYTEYTIPALLLQTVRFRMDTRRKAWYNIEKIKKRRFLIMEIEYKKFDVKRLIAIGLFGFAFLMFYTLLVLGQGWFLTVDMLVAAALCAATILGYKKIRKIVTISWLGYSAFGYFLVVLLDFFFGYFRSGYIYSGVVTWIFGLMAGLVAIAALIFYLIKMKKVFTILAMVFAGITLLCMVLHMITGGSFLGYRYRPWYTFLFYIATLATWGGVILMLMTDQLPMEERAAAPKAPRVPVPSDSNYSPDGQIVSALKALDADYAGGKVSGQDYWANRRDILARFPGSQLAAALSDLDAAYANGAMSAQEYSAQNAKILGR